LVRGGVDEGVVEVGVGDFDLEGEGLPKKRLDKRVGRVEEEGVVGVDVEGVEAFFAEEAVE